MVFESAPVPHPKSVGSSHGTYGVTNSSDSENIVPIALLGDKKTHADVFSISTVWQLRFDEDSGHNV